jgi:CBS domain-containing protein
MKVSEHCKRQVVAVSASADVTAAARLMREAHVGFLVVHRQGDELRKPVGVLTDRDIVLQIIAKGVEPTSVTVEDIMTRQPLVANETDDLTDLLQAMRLAGIRRVPVVDARGALTGIIALDDAIDLVTGLLCEISGSIKSEQRQEWRARQG